MFCIIEHEVGVNLFVLTKAAHEASTFLVKNDLKSTKLNLVSLGDTSESVFCNGSNIAADLFSLFNKNVAFEQAHVF